MNRAKIFIVFTFLLAFAVCVSAQDKTPKIVWKNFPTEYKKLEYITPVIVNESDKSITLLPSWLIKDFVMARLLVFDEENQKWISAGFYLTCGLTKGVEKQTITKILAKEEKAVSLDFGEMFFSFRDRSFNSKNRFKILLEYKLENSDNYFEITSPEFSITEK